MADMTQAEVEGKGPEGQLNTKSEIEPTPTVSVLYRRGNEMMSQLVQRLAGRDLKVVDRSISTYLVSSSQRFCHSEAESRRILFSLDPSLRSG